jgi:hypothetical protein
MTVKFAAFIVADPKHRTAYLEYEHALQIVAQAAYERRLAANTDWEVPRGTLTGKTVSG